MKKRITFIILGLFCFTAVVMLAFSIRVFTTSNIGPFALLLGEPEEELTMITNADQQSVADSDTTQELEPTETATETIQPTPEPTATPTPETTPPPTPTPTPEPTINPVEEQFSNEKLNILMLGWDQSPEREDSSNVLYRDEKNNYRSDVMILLAIDFDQNKIDMVSIPRDSYAEVYNVKGKWKINAAFAKGGSAEGMGFEYAMKTISMLMGDIPIDYYIGVEMEGFKGVVDAMGGVDYDVDVKIKLNDRVLETGFQHLDGQQVLDYCRARKGISTDIGRIDRQQRMLFSIFNQMKSTDQILNIPKIYKAVSDMLYTNLSVEQIAALAVFANGLEESSMQRYTLEGEYMNAYGANFYVLKQEYKNQLIKDIYGFEAPFDKEHDISYVRSQNSKSKKK